MLNDFKCNCPIYLACGYTDLRRETDGLAGMVQQQLHLNPFQMGSPLYRQEQEWNRAGVKLRRQTGATASAVIYSLVEAAKENRLDPYWYLLWLLENTRKLAANENRWAERLLPEYFPS